MDDLIDRDAVAYKVKSCITIPADSEWDSGYNTAMAEAKQYIQNSPAVNRWISVEDALPNDRKCVLVTDGEDIEITYFDGSDWEMRDQYGNHYELYGAVTHWMPLPEQPEKE